MTNCRVANGEKAYIEAGAIGNHRVGVNNQKTLI